MKIHYISHHSVLEYDELKLLTELGHEVYCNGAYRDPRGAHTLPRPGVPGAPFDQRFFELTAQHPKTDLPPELIEPYDLLIFMSGQQEASLLANWQKIKHKKVIWRTIGQSLPHNEASIQPLRAEGLKIIRYSKMEQNITNFAGSDALIYFYKDPEEFKDWNGNDVRPVNFTQSLLGRRYFTHYDEIQMILSAYPESRVYGSGNEDLGVLNGGEIPYDMMKQVMRDSRVFVYGGTWPASYTLSFIEAMMTGMPIVALGRQTAESERFERVRFYEIPEIITHGVNGFISDTLDELRAYTGLMLRDHNIARQISEGARKRAIELFGKEKIKEQWREFLDSL